MKKINLILMSIAILVIMPFISADPDDYYSCSMMYGAFGDFGLGFTVLSWIIYIAIIALAIAGTYYMTSSAP